MSYCFGCQPYFVKGYEVSTGISLCLAFESLDAARVNGVILAKNLIECGRRYYLKVYNRYDDVVYHITNTLGDLVDMEVEREADFV